MVKYFLSVLIIVFSLSSLFICSVASNEYGFETIHLTDDEKQMVWDNLEFKEINLNSAPENLGAIVSFDVSEEENIILGTDENKILVFDKNGAIVSAFEFYSNGSFYLRAYDDNYLLMLVRSSVIVELTLDGELVGMVRADDNSSDNNELWNQQEKNDIYIRENSYVARNKMGLFNLLTSSYSQLVKITDNGSEFVIYDVNSTQLIKIVSTFIIILVFLAWAIMVIFKKGKSGKCSVIEL